MMNSKSAVRWILLVVVFGSVAVYAFRGRSDRSGSSTTTAPKTTAPKTTASNTTAPNTAAPNTTAAAKDAVTAAVVVTYFTTDVRCKSCRTIESLSRQAIDEGFPDEVSRGSVVFRVLNTDRPENEHFVDDYEITNKTVIVSHLTDGKESEWINRQDVWLLLNEPDKFLAYVREPVNRFLGKN
jgi:hypothetical protein